MSTSLLQSACVCNFADYDDDDGDDEPIKVVTKQPEAKSSQQTPKVVTSDDVKVVVVTSQPPYQYHNIGFLSELKHVELVEQNGILRGKQNPRTTSCEIQGKCLMIHEDDKLR